MYKWIKIHQPKLSPKYLFVISRRKITKTPLQWSFSYSLYLFILLPLKIKKKKETKTFVFKILAQNIKTFFFIHLLLVMVKISAVTWIKFSVFSYVNVTNKWKGYWKYIKMGKRFLFKILLNILRPFYFYGVHSVSFRLYFFQQLKWKF